MLRIIQVNKLVGTKPRALARSIQYDCIYGLFVRMQNISFTIGLNRTHVYPKM